MIDNKLKTYLSQTSLARRMNLAPATLANRLREYAILPDALLLQPSKPDGLLFDAARLPELRSILTTPKTLA